MKAECGKTARYSGASREGPNDGKGETPVDPEDAMSQKSDQGPGAQTVGAVKPQGPRLRVEASPAGSGNERLGSRDLMEQRANARTFGLH
jgi:hypothetical protein